MTLRLLIVDDSAVYRQALKAIVEGISGVQCIGVACDGKEALEKISSDKPDVVTLDMEMPVMSGMDVIKAVIERKLKSRLIIVSACSQSGAEATIKALNLGAYDFITKPNRLGGNGAKDELCRQLIEKLSILGCGFKRPLTKTVQSTESSHLSREGNQAAKPSMLARSDSAHIATLSPVLLPKAIVMGSSTGGPKALLKLFSGLQSKLDMPVFIVQHMPPMFTQTLAKSIDEISLVSVKEAEDGEKPLPNHAYIAPGGRQMKLIKGSTGVEIKITDDEPNNFCKPSVDYFFSSVADIYESRVLGIILSGMGEDGSAGLRRMKQHGIKVLGQDEESCVVYGMPRVAQELGLVDEQVSIDNMASTIESVLQSSRKNAEVRIRH